MFNRFQLYKLLEEDYKLNDLINSATEDDLKKNEKYVVETPTQIAYSYPASYTSPPHLNIGNTKISLIKENFYNIEVHGGVTYTGRREFKQPNYIADYVLGFDCGHAGDLVPGINNNLAIEYVYRDIEYVTNECKNLAKQLKELE